MIKPAADWDERYPYDDERFNKGVQHVVDLIARELGVKDWVAGDGSEDYDCDLWQTILNILSAKGIYNKDDGEFANFRDALSARSHQPVPVAANASAEQTITENPDGSVSLDEYAGWSREQLKDRCRELIANVSAEAFVRVLASLAAAISILERTPPAKKAVASDTMFDISLNDYRKALEAGRAALATLQPSGGKYRRG